MSHQILFLAISCLIYLAVGMFLLRASGIGDSLLMLSYNGNAPVLAFALFFVAIFFWPIFHPCLYAWVYAGVSAKWIARKYHQLKYSKKYNTKHLFADAQLVCIGKNIYTVRRRETKCEDGRPTGVTVAWVFRTGPASPVQQIIPDQETIVDHDGTFQVTDSAGQTFWVRLHGAPIGDSDENLKSPVMARAVVINSRYVGMIG